MTLTPLEAGWIFTYSANNRSPGRPRSFLVTRFSKRHSEGWEAKSKDVSDSLPDAAEAFIDLVVGAIGPPESATFLYETAWITRLPVTLFHTWIYPLYYKENAKVLNALYMCGHLRAPSTWHISCVYLYQTEAHNKEVAPGGGLTGPERSLHLEKRRLYSTDARGSGRRSTPRQAAFAEGEIDVDKTNHHYKRCTRT